MAPNALGFPLAQWKTLTPHPVQWSSGSLPFCFENNHNILLSSLWKQHLTPFSPEENQAHFHHNSEWKLVHNERSSCRMEMLKILQFYLLELSDGWSHKILRKIGLPGQQFFSESADQSCNLFLAFHKERNTIAEECWQQQKNALFLEVVKILVWLHRYERKYDPCFCKKAKP